MYIAFGHERADKLARPERRLLDSRVKLVVGEVVERGRHANQTVELAR